MYLALNPQNSSRYVNVPSVHWNRLGILPVSLKKSFTASDLLPLTWSLPRPAAPPLSRDSFSPSSFPFPLSCSGCVSWILYLLLSWLFSFLYVFLEMSSRVPSNSSVGFSSSLFLIFFNINLFIYLFLAALGLHCCARAFSSCGEWGLLFSCGARALGAWASVVVARGLSSCGALGLVALRHVGSPRTRARTRVPCIGRRILNHCTTREVPDRRLFSQLWAGIAHHQDPKKDKNQFICNEQINLCGKGKQ